VWSARDLAVVFLAASSELAAAGIVDGVGSYEVLEPHLVVQRIYFPPVCHPLWYGTGKIISGASSLAAPGELRCSF
jgi:hypothetical protein